MADSLVLAAALAGARSRNELFHSGAIRVPVSTGGVLTLSNVNTALQEEMDEFTRMGGAARAQTRENAFYKRPAAWAARVITLLRLGAYPAPWYRRALSDEKERLVDSRVSGSEHVWFSRDAALRDVLREFDDATQKWKALMRSMEE